MVAATGHAPEELTGLREDEVEFFPGGVRLRLTKRRAHQVRTREFRDPVKTVSLSHADSAGLGVAEVVRRLLAVTEGARERSRARPPLLFTRASVIPAASANAPRGQLMFKQFEPVGRGGELSEWAQRVGVSVTGRLDIRRLRKSTKVEKAIAFRGVVSDIADDHTAETFWGHYAHGTTLRVISGRTITAAQQLWLDQTLDGPVVLDSGAEQQLTSPETITELGLTRQQADDIRQGALDMGVTSCRDPYDSPYAKQGTLCSVALLRCLECRNAFVLPSNLPQLLLFADHLHRLGDRLTPQHFHQLWGRSRANLQAVLTDRSPAELERARAQIADQGPRLQLPLSSFVEFDG